MSRPFNFWRRWDVELNQEKEKPFCDYTWVFEPRLRMSSRESPSLDGQVRFSSETGACWRSCVDRLELTILWMRVLLDFSWHSWRIEETWVLMTVKDPWIRADEEVKLRSQTSTHSNVVLGSVGAKPELHDSKHVLWRKHRDLLWLKHGGSFQFSEASVRQFDQMPKSLCTVLITLK